VPTTHQRYEVARDRTEVYRKNQELAALKAQ
jgi:hypothetical protein